MAMIDSAPRAMGSGPVGASALLGQRDQGAREQADIAERIRGTMKAILQLNQNIDGIATQFPVASEQLDAAKEALRQAMKAIIANQVGPEPPASPALG